MPSRRSAPKLSLAPGQPQSYDLVSPPSPEYIPPEPLPLRSKRTERLRKREGKKAVRSTSVSPFDLPPELVLEILSRVTPRDIFVLQRTSKSLQSFVFLHERTIAHAIIRFRYASLAKCFRLPVLLSEVPVEFHEPLQNASRQLTLSIHGVQYQHVKSPDQSLICTCLACSLRWNSLCLVVDFAYWQGHLDRGEALPVIKRGEAPTWNRELVASHAAVVTKALKSPMWYARILEMHLSSTVRSISRHAQNQNNKRRRFALTEADVRSGTDVVFEQHGPASVDFPYSRELYYMLEAYLPNRGWNSEDGRWMYTPASQHDIDISFIQQRWGA
jgi:hypothetical protein